MLAIGGYNFGEPLPPGEHLNPGSLELLLVLGVVLVVLYLLTVYLNYQNYRRLKRIEKRLIKP
jgi:hypothetical protein